jgi:hypothetical protein
MVERVAALQARIENGQAETTHSDVESRVCTLEASIREKQTQMAHGEMVTRAIAHQRARIEAAEAAGAEGGHPEFFWTREPPGGGGCFKQVVVVLENPAEVDEDWERAVFLFVWLDRTDFCAGEEEPEAEHEICVEIALRVTAAAKMMHGIRYGNSNIVASWFEPWLGTRGEPDPDTPSPLSLSRAERMAERMAESMAESEVPTIPCKSTRSE